MEEHQVGITEYTTATTGFNGILKHRYEDFQVFEVDLTGRTAHLTDLSAPEPEEPVPNAQLTDASITDIIEAITEKAGPENAAKLRTLLTNIQRYQQQSAQPAQPGSVPAKDAVSAGADAPAAATAAANAAPAAAPAAAGASKSNDAAAAAAAAAGAGGSSGQQVQEEQSLVAYLLPIKTKEARKAVHTFLKTDPRLPPLETDTVGATTGPEAAAAAAEAAALEAAAEAAKPLWQRHRDPSWLNPDQIEAQKQKDAEALNIIRVRLSEDVQGLARKRGVAAQNNQQKEHRKAMRKHRGWQTSQWLGGEDKYTKFVLLKENMDTQAALTVVGRMLHLHSHAFGFAGTKDRRGVTTQYVTLFKVDPRKLTVLNPRLRGIKLGNFEFCGSPLQLGQLRGNAFRILMRDVNTHDEQHIAAAVAEVRNKGFINYFGLQRFGTGNVPTHRVGAALLRGEWKAAVQLILQGTPHEKDDIRAARDKYTKHGDIKGALDKMPTWMVAERAILQTLHKQGPTSYTAALQAVPRTLRSMYMHAWQSWCWNTAASERIRRYRADKVVAGDLVLPPSAAAAAGGGGAAAGEADALAAGAAAGANLEAMDTDAAAAAATAAGEEGVDAAGADVEGSSAASRLAAIHVVTAEEAQQGKYSITDVVLPLPGGQVQYPEHAAGWELYCRLAAADGILLPGETDAEYEAAAAAVAAAATAGGSSVENGTTAAAAAEGQQDAAAEAQPAAVTKARQHGVKEFQLAGLSGDYRRVLHVPSVLQHKVVRYTDPNQPDLLPTDIMQLQGSKQQQQQQGKRKRGRQGEGGQQQEQAAEQQEAKRQKQDGQQQQQEGDQAGDANEQQQEKKDQLEAMEVEQTATAAGDQGASDTPLPAAAAAAAANGNCEIPGAAAGKSGTAAATAAAAGSEGQGAQQERVGVILKFSLPSSCYATMLIRELTKQSTSKAAHKQLSAKQPGQ